MWKIPGDSAWALEQNLHEPTRAYGEEIHEKVQEIGYLNALEIGAAWGVSTLAILMVGDGDLTSVDINVVPNTEMLVDTNGFSERWALAYMPSEEFWKVISQDFDLIYVDGSHVYHEVKNDLFEAWKRLLPGGYLMIDDITHIKNLHADVSNKRAEYGVSLAVWELIFAFKDEIESISPGKRILTIRKV